MAIKLPKYQKQVGVASGAEVYKDVDERAALAPIQAASQAIGATTDMAMEFGARLKKHKDDGDFADHNNKYKTWEATLEQKKKEARLAGVKDEEIMEKVIVPAMEGFQKGIEEAGYSKKVRGLVDKDWSARIQAVEAREQSDIVQNAIIRSNLSKVEYAKGLERDGNLEGADAVWSELESTMKPEQLQKEKSQSRVGRELVTIRQADNDFLSGNIDRDEYEKILTESNDIIQADSGVTEDDKHRHKIETIGKMNNIVRQKSREQSSAISEFRTLDRKGELGGIQLEELERVMGKDYSDVLTVLNFESMKRKAVSDEDMAKAFALVNNFSSTEGMDFYKTIKRAEKIGGKAGKRAFWQISELYKERIDKDVEVATPMQSYRTDFFEQLTRLSSTREKYADWYDDRMLRFETWLSEYPNASQEDYFDFRYKELKTDVADFVGTFTAPQDSSTERTITRTGKTADGRKVVQYSDGTVEYAD